MEFAEAIDNSDLVPISLNLVSSFTEFTGNKLEPLLFYTLTDSLKFAIKAGAYPSASLTVANKSR